MNILNPLTRPAVPVDADLALLEPSFADAVAAIAGDPNLAAAVKTHWCCSLRRMAAFLDRPMVLIPARWTSVRMPAGRLKAAALGLTQKTLSNHFSNVRAALSWMHKEKRAPARGVALSPEWQALSDQCPKLPHRARLLPLMRFCSAHAIAPGAVDEAVIDSLMDYRRSTTSLAVDAKARRSMARSWNDRVRTVAGWPRQLLVEPPSRTLEAFPPWEAYPISLREEIEAYLDSLARVRKTAKGKLVLPAKATTIKSRRSSLEAALRTASRIGIGMDELDSLSSFLDPAVSRRVLEAYWPEGAKQPPIFAVDLCGLFVGMAHSANCLPPDKLEELEDMLARLKHESPRGMTNKNLAAIRSFMQGEAWRTLLRLPQDLMAEAKEASYSSPTKAGIRAQLAVAIGILSAAPIRRGNLGAIRIGENLIRTGGPESPYRLVFPDYDVKNRVKLDFNLDAELTALIDDYLFNYRPALIGRADNPWLFPGEGENHKTLKVLSDQITAVIEKAIGLRLTPHQFRHLSAAIILKHKPGNYQLVRLLLGHRTEQVTIRNYIGLESVWIAPGVGMTMTEKAKNDRTGADRSPKERPQRESATVAVRSAPIAEWTIADQAAWRLAMAPRARLRKGGAGGHLAPITQRDLARRYGYFVDHLIRKGLFERDAGPAAQVSADHVASFIEELRARVGSVTTAGTVYKLRRVAELLDPSRSFAWLAEIEKDLALMMRPKSKDNRLVDPDRLVEAGLALVEEATASHALTPLRRARQVRDGLIISLLALCPIRLKNFAALELQASFRRIGTQWWIVLDRNETKSGRPDERRVARDLDAAIEAYFLVHRPILAETNKGSDIEALGSQDRLSDPPDAEARCDDPLARITGPLWLSSNTGERMSYCAVERVITETTRMTLGVAVSPHLFRSCAATAIYTHAGDNPNLASAVLQHTDHRVTEQHYNRASSVDAARQYAEMLKSIRA